MELYNFVNGLLTFTIIYIIYKFMSNKKPNIDREDKCFEKVKSLKVHLRYDKDYRRVYDCHNKTLFFRHL